MLHNDKERQIMVFLSKLAKTTFSKSQQGVIPHAFYLCLCYSASISSVIHYSIQNPICHSALFPFVTPHTPSCHSRDIFLSFPPPSLSFRAIAGIQEVFLYVIPHLMRNPEVYSKRKHEFSIETFRNDTHLHRLEGMYLYFASRESTFYYTYKKLVWILNKRF